MEYGNDGNKPYAHDQNSIWGHLAPSSLISVELKHCTGAATTSSSGSTTEGELYI
uniref:Uncharacterized protein n=1 Tax=Aegilops tauschii TaxID=37682 RepID=N1QST8_AEGTA